MGKLGMDCGRGMYYDYGTQSCAYCSELCHLVDIQGTREECEKKCPGYLTTTTLTTSPPWTITTGSPSSTTTSSVIQNPAFISFLCLLSVAILAVICYIIYKNKEKLVDKLKKQDCCGDGKSTQPHAQETGAAGQPPEAHDLLANAAQGFPDMPNRSLSHCSRETTCPLLPCYNTSYQQRQLTELSKNGILNFKTEYTPPDRHTDSDHTRYNRAI